MYREGDTRTYVCVHESLFIFDVTFSGGGCLRYGAILLGDWVPRVCHWSKPKRGGDREG